MDKKSIWYFSKKEKFDLLVSWATLSVAFGIVLSNNFLNFFDLALALPISFVAVGTGFVFHEVAHRQAARRYGFHSEFRMWKEGLIFALVLAVVSMGNFIFAAPGATYFYGENVSRKQNGVISIAGPITNLILGALMLILALVMFDPFIASILVNAAWINFWFAFFNLLPIFPLDGAKVLHWNKGLWAVCILIAGVLSFMPGTLLSFLGL